MPPIPPLKRGDGNLHITIVDMGQGDCILVALPNGKTMIIDCGTMRWEATNLQTIVATVYDVKFLKGYNIVDVLILTHPDRDHCSQLQSVLTQESTDIKSVYYSCGDLDEYEMGGAGRWLLTAANVKRQNIYSVAINTSGKKFNGKVIPVESDALKTNVLVTRDGKQFVKILDGTRVSKTASFKQCEVFLLAGDVGTYPNINDNDEGYNRRSLVTMIVYGSKKFMFCGDATFHAEKFMKDTYDTAIQNIHLFQVAHHGSLKTSSSCNAVGDNDPAVKAIGFVDFVNAERVVISSARDSGPKLGLPRLETVDKYLGIPNKNLLARASHTVSGYRFVPAVYASNRRKKLANSYNDLQGFSVDYDILSTGSEGTIDYVYSDDQV